MLRQKDNIRVLKIFKDNLLRKLMKIRGYYTVRALKYRHYKNRNLCIGRSQNKRTLQMKPRRKLY